MTKYPLHLLKLIDALKKLPGVGKKSAERFAFQMLNWSEGTLCEMGDIIKDLRANVKLCDQCGCLQDIDTCQFCKTSRLNSQIICVVASPRDAFTMEETREYHGLYHVLGGVLSPMHGFGPERLNIKKLVERITLHQIREVVIALDSTLEGDATSLYLKKELEPLQLQISRLAFGLPVGSSLEFVDGGTLARAFSSRNRF